MQWFKNNVAIKVSYTVIIFLCTYHPGYANYLLHSQGKTTEITFHYYIKGNLSVEISFNDNKPFYKTGKLIPEVLSFGQAQRYSVNVTHYSSIIEVKLSIVKLDIEDEGCYVCEVYDENNESNRLTQEIDLAVKELIEEPSCHVFSHSKLYGGLWSVLECSVPINENNNNDNKQFYCFQNSEIIPPKTDPVAENNELKQTFWVKNHLSISCCIDYNDTLDQTCAHYKWYLNEWIYEATQRFNKEDWSSTVYAQSTKGSTFSNLLSKTDKYYIYALSVVSFAASIIIIVNSRVCTKYTRMKTEKNSWKNTTCSRDIHV